MRCHLQISSYRIDLISVNGPISPKQCYYETDYSFYSFYWLDSLEIRLDHNSTYYHSLSKNSDVKPRISHCDSQNLQYKTHPEFWPSRRRIFKTSLYYKTHLILETRWYVLVLKYQVISSCDTDLISLIVLEQFCTKILNLQKKKKNDLVIQGLCHWVLLCSMVQYNDMLLHAAYWWWRQNIQWNL